MAKLTGNLIKFTWTGGGGGETLSTTRGHHWELQSRTRMANTTPEQAPVWEEYTPGTSTGIVTADFFVDGGDATPPIPSGVRGTAVLFPNYAASSKKYTVTAYIESFEFIATSNTGGQPEVCRYRFQVSWDGSTNAIIPA